MTDQTLSASAGLAGSGLRTSCPVCGCPTGEPFVRIPAQPVHCNVLWTTRAAAVDSPRGDLDLVFCPTCAHVFNAAFDDSLTTYGATYENSLHHSAVFQGYADELVTTLVERHGLRDRDVVEIGSGGQGDFLEALCTRGGNRGVGFDPSYVGPAQVSEHVRVVADFYGEQFADQPADLIVCRHVLEHIGASGDFVGMVRRVIGDRDVTAFFEVPDARWTLLHGGIWDLIYEHCGYFTPTSLRAAFELNGFAVDDVGTVFGDQFLTIEATPSVTTGEVSPSPADEVAELADAVQRFADLHTQTIGRWRDELRSRAGAGQRGVIWGAGSKGVTFLNVVDTSQVCDRAVDINPRKHGMYVSGAGQAVVGPDTLPHDPPDFVLVMNPNYRDEIGVQLRELGIDADVLVV